MTSPDRKEGSPIATVEYGTKQAERLAENMFYAQRNLDELSKFADIGFGALMEEDVEFVKGVLKLGVAVALWLKNRETITISAESKDSTLSFETTSGSQITSKENLHGFLNTLWPAEAEDRERKDNASIQNQINSSLNRNGRVVLKPSTKIAQSRPPTR